MVTLFQHRIRESPIITIPDPLLYIPESCVQQPHGIIPFSLFLVPINMDSKKIPQKDKTELMSNELDHLTSSWVNNFTLESIEKKVKNIKYDWSTYTRRVAWNEMRRQTILQIGNVLWSTKQAYDQLWIEVGERVL